MSAQLPIKTATLGGTAITEDEFVFGSGSLQIQGADTSVTTADGKLHHERRFRSFQGGLELYGDRTSLNTAAGLAASQTLGTVSFTGLVTATFDRNSNTTRVEVKGDPQRT